ncbi:MAG: asparagine synthase (glutamine-hydrolyzing) [Solirubrobacterales bacterium]
MCGIAGIVSYGAPPDREALARMTRVLAHRGPDDEGLFLEGPCGLGFRRLAIIDLVTGDQPMSAGPATVVFNGEIYNYRERRTELERLGHRFETSSDTEVLLHAYLQWGEDFTPRLDGMFAFAIWDRSQRRLVAGRDRFGKKPFYYLHRGELFLFGSELKALLEHPACGRVIDRAALRRYLAFECVPTPHAIFEGVRKLREGHTLTLSSSGLREVRYFVLPPAAPEPKRGERGRRADEAAIGLRERLDAAVRKRLVADVPLGVLLSGGIDSSAVTALAAALKPGLKTFWVGFAESSFVESRYAELAARTFGTSHQSEQLSARACLDLIPRAVDQLDEPLGDASYLPTSLLSQFTRRQVTVALGGDGADELFGGYDSFIG